MRLPTQDLALPRSLARRYSAIQPPRKTGAPPARWREDVRARPTLAQRLHRVGGWPFARRRRWKESARRLLESRQRFRRRKIRRPGSWSLVNSLTSSSAVALELLCLVA